MRKPEHRKVPGNRLRCATAFAGVDAGIAVSMALPVTPKYQDGQAVAAVAVNRSSNQRGGSKMDG